MLSNIEKLKNFAYKNNACLIDDGFCQWTVGCLGVLANLKEYSYIRDLIVKKVLSKAILLGLHVNNTDNNVIITL